MLVLSVQVGEGLQVGPSTFLQLVAKDTRAIAVAITTRLPKFDIDLGGGNVVSLSDRPGQRVKVAVKGDVAPVTITPPGIIPQAFACGMDGISRYIPRRPGAMASAQ